MIIRSKFVLLALFLLGCNIPKDYVRPKAATEFEMKCAVISMINQDYKDIHRCENTEAICYSWGTGISCFKKS